MNPPPPGNNNGDDLEPPPPPRSPPPSPRDNNNADLVMFPAGRPGHSSRVGHEMFDAPHTHHQHQQHHQHQHQQHRSSHQQHHHPRSRENSLTSSTDNELMGPLLRRKKVVSLPLGAGGDFFYTAATDEPHGRIFDEQQHQQQRRRVRTHSYNPHQQQQQQQQATATTGGAAGTGLGGDYDMKLPGLSSPPQSPRVRKHRQVTPQPRFMQNLVRRRQISLDLLGPNDFFGVPDEDEEEVVAVVVDDFGVVSETLKEEREGEEEEGEVAAAVDEAAAAAASGGGGLGNLFWPLRFAPRKILKSSSSAAGGHHGGGGGGGYNDASPLPPQSTTTEQTTIDPEMQQVLERYTIAHEQVQAELMRLSKTIPEETSEDLLLSNVVSKMKKMSSDHDLVKQMASSRSLLGMSSGSTSSLHTTKQQSSSGSSSSILDSVHQVPNKIDENVCQDDDDDDGENKEKVSSSTEDEEVEKDNLIKDDDVDDDTASDDDDIIHATRKDMIRAAACFCVMLCVTLIVTLWETHSADDVFILDPVGIACVTPCEGDIETKDFFHGHYKFEGNEVIDLILHLDPYNNNNNEEDEQEQEHRALVGGYYSRKLSSEQQEEMSAADDEANTHSDDRRALGSYYRKLSEQQEMAAADDDGNEALVVVEIIGNESGMMKVMHEFGPANSHDRTSFHKKIVADFDNPGEPHVINVYSSKSDGGGGDGELSFTLLANVQAPLSDYSVIVAAVIMVVVYTLILLEVIHRTLIAIFGSMVALMFFFAMENGHVESIKIIMLHLEWSTLGLLFGMMLIVGELSHTGVFEWCAVHILIFSKGSYVRLLILLSTLTAVASAFLDNVTTMLLVAPVTIDMCHIVGDIDPRPYLIAEVLLSNIGGTATLIGDPPNIIIGSAFSEIIGFVDFIIHIAPVIFVFCIPVSLALVVWIYRWYLTSSKMRVLDTALLKRTYRIYDEPRLLISGIVTSFVILMFFLHPVHHKDTAWIALLGAFITIAFTNPHDVQSALRDHVEWDTLLFFAGLFVLVEVCAAMGLLDAIGSALANLIGKQDEENQLTVAITLLLWVSAFASSFLDNIPYTATMIPVIEILSYELPDTLPLQTLAWALSLGACLGGNGTLLGASANIVTAGISANKGYEISFVNFLYPGMLVMIVTVAISNVYMLARYVWLA